MNNLSLEDCVFAVMTDSSDEVWKCPSKLAKKLIKYGYLSDSEITTAIQLFYRHNPIKFQYRRSKRDTASNNKCWKSEDIFEMNLRRCLKRYFDSQTNPMLKVKSQREAPICMTPLDSIYQYMSKEEIISKLRDKTNQKINMDNLNYVFSFCVRYGHKNSFYLSCNGHGISARVFHRNLARLEKLKLIACMKKGRQYNLKNIMSGNTNLASRYELLFNVKYAVRAVVATPAKEQVVEPASHQNKHSLEVLL